MREHPARAPRRSDAAARRPYRSPLIPVPPRKVLPHDVPTWIDPATEISSQFVVEAAA